MKAPDEPVFVAWDVWPPSGATDPKGATVPERRGSEAVALLDKLATPFENPPEVMAGVAVRAFVKGSDFLRCFDRVTWKKQVRSCTLASVCSLG